jgi:hypothetical protein
MMALSLPLGEAECDCVLGAMLEIVELRQALLPQRHAVQLM